MSYAMILLKTRLRKLEHIMETLMEIRVTHRAIEKHIVKYNGKASSGTPLMIVQSKRNMRL